MYTLNVCSQTWKYFWCYFWAHNYCCVDLNTHNPIWWSHKGPLWACWTVADPAFEDVKRSVNGDICQEVDEMSSYSQSTWNRSAAAFVFFCNTIQFAIQFAIAWQIIDRYCELMWKLITSYCAQPSWKVKWISYKGSHWEIWRKCIDFSVLNSLVMKIPVSRVFLFQLNLPDTTDKPKFTPSSVYNQVPFTCSNG